MSWQLAVFAVFAVANWIAVTPRFRKTTIEYVCKPCALAALIAFAVTLDPADPTQQAWFVAALILSLAGDVFLMLPSDRFVPGLAAFLLAHVAYVIGLFAQERGFPWTPVLVIPVTALVGSRVLHSTPRKLKAPVAAYMTVITVMVALALGSGSGYAALGACLFFASDALIAWNRFVRPMPWVRPVIMATYHLGQAGLVLSLAR